jgi:hypothetical protein
MRSFQQYVLFQCGKDLEVDKVKNCVNGKDGLRFLSEMGNKTSNLDPQLQSVPAVAINNVRKHQVFLREWNLVKLSAVDYWNGGR